MDGSHFVHFILLFYGVMACGSTLQKRFAEKKVVSLNEKPTNVIGYNFMSDLILIAKKT